MDWKSTISKILAKADDKATPQVERENLESRAAYLMAKYGIQEHMLNNSTNVIEQPIVRRIKKGNPHKRARDILLKAVADSYNVQSINDGDEFHLIGLPGDVERAEFLYSYLLVQGFRGLEEAYQQKPSWEHGKTFKHSWFFGFVQAASKRVRDAAASATSEAQTENPGTDLVLANNKDRVAAFVADAYGKIGTTRIRFRPNSGNAFALGITAGNSADIGQSRLGGPRRALGA